MAFRYIQKVELTNGVETRLGVGTVLDDKLNEMQACISLAGSTGFYLTQEQLDEFIYTLSQVDLKR